MSVHFKVAVRLGFGLCCVLIGLCCGLRLVLAQGETNSLWQSFLSGDGIPSGNVLSISCAAYMRIQTAHSGSALTQARANMMAVGGH